MAIINLFLRLSSLFFLILTFACAGWPQALHQQFNNMHTTAQLAGLAASPLFVNFFLPILAAIHFALASITGYGATFYAPKDKVKLFRGLLFYYAIPAYLILKDTLDGKTEIFKDLQTAYVTGGTFAFFAVISFLLSFTSGGVPTHQAAKPQATPAKSKKAQ